MFIVDDREGFLLLGFFQGIEGNDQIDILRNKRLQTIHPITQNQLVFSSRCSSAIGEESYDIIKQDHKESRGNIRSTTRGTTTTTAA